MIKTVANRVWAFDLEWVPDPLAGRLLYDIPEEAEPEEILQEMWEQGGATAENPTPYLKTALCRIVSIAAVERRVKQSGEITLHLLSLPRQPQEPAETGETRLVTTFLDALGKHQPQLVGFNSKRADLKILVQRGLILGIGAAGFCRTGRDERSGYFGHGSDWHVDLKEITGGWGKATPALRELAVLSGVPCKLGVDGSQVAQLWLGGELEKIVHYNQADALTTYLVWLRLAHFAGHFNDQQYQHEQQLVRGLLEQESSEPGKEHLAEYLQAWQQLQSTIGDRD